MIVVTNDERLHRVCDLFKELRKIWKRIDALESKLASNTLFADVRVLVKEDLAHWKTLEQQYKNELNKYKRNDESKNKPTA
jgi:hypothetical protein